MNPIGHKLLPRIVPPGVATAETTGALPKHAAYAEELQAISRAVPRRREEFLTGRALARHALQHLGLQPGAILVGDRGQPLWPQGVVGSITHCDGFRGAAVASARDLVALGIDAEPNAHLPEDSAELVVGDDERHRLGRLPYKPAVHWDRAIFCAKEAVYKAWYPTARSWLDFTDVDVEIDPAGTFRAAVAVAAPPRLPSVFTGRWVAGAGIVACAVTVPA